MLTMHDVEHGIRHYGVVELGGELAFPLGMAYAEAADRLQTIANQTGGFVRRGERLGRRWLEVHHCDDIGFWLLVWHDSEIEIKRFNPETKRFTYNRPAAAGA